MLVKFWKQCLAVAVSTLACGVHADSDTEALAKAVQNPVASMISVPIQANIDFDWGPEGDTFAVTNIQPVIPIDLNDDWTLVTRTILPVVTQPGIAPGQGRKTGLGDTQFTGFFVPNNSGDVIWGIGPVIQLPTATDSRLGREEWGVGPSFVALAMPGRWVLGGLVNNIWGFKEDEGNEVNMFTFQPFVNYNFDEGLYVSFSPIITANWEASSSETWTVPIGGGIGKVFKVGTQAMNAQAHYYYNLEKPDITGDWSIRLQIQFLFPR